MPSTVCWITIAANVTTVSYRASNKTTCSFLRLFLVTFLAESYVVGKDLLERNSRGTSIRSAVRVYKIQNVVKNEAGMQNG